MGSSRPVIVKKFSGRSFEAARWNRSVPREPKISAQSTPALYPDGVPVPQTILRKVWKSGLTKNILGSIAYEVRTKSAKSGGLEKNGRREEFRVSTGASQSGGLRTRVGVTADFCALASRRRMLVAVGLAVHVVSCEPVSAMAAFINREKYSEFCDCWGAQPACCSKKSPIYGLFYDNSQR